MRRSDWIRISLASSRFILSLPGKRRSSSLPNMRTALNEFFTWFVCVCVCVCVCSASAEQQFAEHAHRAQRGLHLVKGFGEHLAPKPQTLNHRT